MIIRVTIISVTERHEIMSAPLGKVCICWASALKLERGWHAFTAVKSLGGSSSKEELHPTIFRETSVTNPFCSLAMTWVLSHLFPSDHRQMSPKNAYIGCLPPTCLGLSHLVLHTGHPSPTACALTRHWDARPSTSMTSSGSSTHKHSVSSSILLVQLLSKLL